MKKIYKWLPAVLLLVFSLYIVVSFATNLYKRKQSEKTVVSLKDSIGKINFERNYMSQLINIGLTENNKEYLFDSIKVFEITSTGKQPYPKSLQSIFKEGRKKIVIRYTEVGCNSCADVTFNLIQKYNLKEIYDILILVDFSNYEYYLKWKKIADITYPVFWVKKGDIPFQIDKQNSSYLFMIDSDLVPRNFFIPNSQLKSYVRDYLLSAGKTTDL